MGVEIGFFLVGHVQFRTGSSGKPGTEHMSAVVACHFLRYQENHLLTIPAQCFQASHYSR